MSQKKKTCDSTVPDQFQRLYEAAGCRTQADLAALLGIRQSSVSLAQKQGKIPDTWLAKLYRMGIDLEKVNPSETPARLKGFSEELRPPDRVILRNILYCIPLSDLLEEIDRRKIKNQD